MKKALSYFVAAAVCGALGCPSVQASDLAQEMIPVNNQQGSAGNSPSEMPVNKVPVSVPSGEKVPAQRSGGQQPAARQHHSLEGAFAKLHGGGKAPSGENPFQRFNSPTKQATTPPVKVAPYNNAGNNGKDDGKGNDRTNGQIKIVKVIIIKERARPTEHRPTCRGSGWARGEGRELRHLEHEVRELERELAHERNKHSFRKFARGD